MLCDAAVQIELVRSFSILPLLCLFLDGAFFHLELPSPHLLERTPNLFLFVLLSLVTEITAVRIEGTSATTIAAATATTLAAAAAAALALATTAIASPLLAAGRASGRAPIFDDDSNGAACSRGHSHHGSRYLGHGRKAGSAPRPAPD